MGMEKQKPEKGRGPRGQSQGKEASRRYPEKARAH